MTKNSMAALAFFAGLLLFSPRAHAITDKRDIYALQQIRAEVLSGNASPEWRGVLSRWEASTHDPCGDPTIQVGQYAPAFGSNNTQGAWEGVNCRYQESLPPNVPRRITNLHLPEYHLGGPILRSFSLLQTLVELDFDNDVFTGPIPWEIGCMWFLKEIDVSYNNLTGTVPVELLNIRHLEQFKISGNSNMTGCLPTGMPPFADRKCNETTPLSCTPYFQEHSDLAPGTRNAGTNITYCDPSAFRPCINSGKQLTSDYSAYCPPTPVTAFSTRPVAVPPPPPPGRYVGPLLPADWTPDTSTPRTIQGANGIVRVCPSIPQRVIDDARADYPGPGAGYWEQRFIELMLNFLDGPPGGMHIFN